MNSAAAASCTYSSLNADNIPDFSVLSLWTSPDNAYPIGQCTWFACGACLQLYGNKLNFNFPGAAGNGINWVSSLTARYPQYFEKSNAPAAGSIFSGGSAPYGHVGVVLKVEGNSITYFDGNYDGLTNSFEAAKSDWKITTTSISSFNAIYSPVYANPTGALGIQTEKTNETANHSG